MRFLRLNFILNIPLLSVISLTAQEISLDPVYEASHFKKITQHHMKSLSWNEESWSETNYSALIRRIMHALSQPKPFRTRRVSLNLLGAYKAHLPSTATLHEPLTAVIDETTWQNLELLSGSESDKPCLVSIVDRTHTHLGKAALAQCIADPLLDIQELEKRQAIIRLLVDDEQLFNKLHHAYQTLKKSETYLLSFWYPQDLMLQQVRQQCLFKSSAFTRFNTGTTLLTCKTWLAHYERIFSLCATSAAIAVLTTHGATGILGLTTPRFIQSCKDRFGLTTGIGEWGPIISAISLISRNKIFQSCLCAATGIGCSLGIRSMAEWMRDRFFLEQCIYERVQHIARYVASAQTIATIVHNNEKLASLFDEGNDLNAFFNCSAATHKKRHNALLRLKSTAFKKKYLFFEGRGTTIGTHTLIHQIKEDFPQLFNALAQLDVYLSFATLVKESGNQRVKWCFATYKKSSEPHCVLKDFWNPFVDPQKVVANSIEIDQKGVRNIIVSGPNAGGKSTALKAIGIACVLAQTCGIVPAQCAELTPCCIRTHLNITDDISGGNSLFKAEAQRAAHLLSCAKETAQQGRCCLLIMDELFNGTTPIDGQAAAFSFAKHLASYPTVINIVATHFDLLTKLEDRGLYTNYKIESYRNERGELVYNFKLAPGISHERVALDVLKSSHIPDDIINNAKELIDNCTAVS